MVAILLRPMTWIDSNGTNPSGGAGKRTPRSGLGTPRSGLLRFGFTTSRLLKNSPRLADEAGVVAHVEVEVADKAAGSAGLDPSPA